MPGIFDMLMGAMGRPDPSMQLAARLGQAPGQPGSNTGPSPGAPPPQGGPGGGGAPQTQQGAPPAAQGPPGGPGGPSAPTMGNGQPAPQAFASPSDLGSMYLQLAQRQQASENFNRVLGLLAASAYPGRRPDIIMNAMKGNTQDPAALFGNLMQLQMAGQQQQNYQRLQQSLPAMLSAAGIDQSYAPLVASNPDMLSKVVEAQMGISGDPAQRELAQARSQWMKANPGKTESDMLEAHPEYQGVIAYGAAKQAEAKQATDQAADLASDQHSFPSADADYRQTEGMLSWLKAHPAAAADAVQKGALATGRLGQGLTAIGINDPDTATAAGYLAQLQGKLYSEGWKGRGGRLSQLEAGKISEGFSQLNNPSLPATQINQQISDLYDKTMQAHADTYGAAGMPTPSDYYGRMDDGYKKGGKLFRGATELTTPGGASQAGAPQGPGSSGSPAAAPAAGGGTALTGDSLAKVKAAIAANPHDRDTIIARVKANGFDTSGL